MKKDKLAAEEVGIKPATEEGIRKFGPAILRLLFEEMVLTCGLAHK